MVVEQSTQADLDAALAKAGVSILTTGVLGWPAIARYGANLCARGPNLGSASSTVYRMVASSMAEKLFTPNLNVV